MWTPRPIDTSRIRLPERLEALTERLAENHHDLWALQRIAGGWSHGPRHNDTRKKHPDLTSYAELPESEKAHDRIAAMETLKAIVALGYRIEPPAVEAAAAMDVGDDQAMQVLARLTDPAPLELTALLSDRKSVV